MEGAKCRQCGARIEKGAEHCYRCLLSAGLEGLGPGSAGTGTVSGEAVTGAGPARRAATSASLETGMHFGPYEILAPLGAGGMGEVYLAEDSRLGRKIALKVLRRELAREPDHLKRFEREARLLASLSHANVGSLYGVEESAGVRALALELVEGPSLHERVGGRPLAPATAVRIARQIAEALEAAHARGILHRDLKPSNIKITKDGTVKVLDFGLAKILDPAIERGEASRVPTASDATLGNVIVGTAPYMSPEQARGEPLDFGTDIWAFGCVMYEMLTGRPAFAGRTTTDILALILEREPDWTRLPRGTPPDLARLLKRCLRKEPRRRLQHIGEARAVLEDIQEGRDEKGNAATEPRLRQFRSVAPWLLSGLLLGVAGALTVVHWREPLWEGTVRRSTGAIRFTAEWPAGLKMATGLTHELAVSPDGGSLVFAAQDGDTTRLFLRSMRESTARPIPGTEGGVAPFFSPDGAWIGFFTKEDLKKVPTTGGEPVILGRRLNLPALAASWGPDGTIVFGSLVDPLFRISDAGGQRQPLTRLDVEAEEKGHMFPEFLPDGRSVLFTVGTGPGIERIEALDLASGVRKVVIEEGSSPVYVDGGYLVYSHRDTLMAVPFDAQDLTVTGTPVPLVNDIAVAVPGDVAHFALSRGGALAYIAGGDVKPRRALMSVDRAGASRSFPVDERGYTACRLSPDGRWLAVATLELQDTGIWVSPIDRPVFGRLPLRGRVAEPLWDPDGLHILFGGTIEGRENVFTAPIDGSAPPTPVASNPLKGWPTSWSPDGRSLVFQEAPPSPFGWRVRSLEVSEDGGRSEPVTLAGGGVSFGGTVSPDGRWLAYASQVSNEHMEVFVQAFPGGGERRQISAHGGLYPAWSPLGDELFYVRGAGFGATSLADAPWEAEAADSQPEFIAVGVKPGAEGEFGAERVLFRGDFHYGQWGMRHYDVAPDAQSFVMPGRDHDPLSPRIHVILNWTDEITERVPAPHRPAAP